MAIDENAETEPIKRQCCTCKQYRPYYRLEREAYGESDFVPTGTGRCENDGDDSFVYDSETCMQYECEEVS